MPAALAKPFRIEPPVRQNVNMDRDLIQDYLTRSGMDAAQADTLSKILSDMESRLATKSDIIQLRGEMATLKADLTWRMIAIVAVVNGLFGTAIALAGTLIN